MGRASFHSLPVGSQSLAGTTAVSGLPFTKGSYLLASNLSPFVLLWLVSFRSHRLPKALQETGVGRLLTDIHFRHTQSFGFLGSSTET